MKKNKSHYLLFLSAADHFSVGGTAGPERSVHLRLHHHPPDAGQSVSTGRNNSKPGLRALADVWDHQLWVHLSTSTRGGFHYKIRAISTSKPFLQNKSRKGWATYV